MSDSIKNIIELKIRKSKPGQLFLLSDFKNIGTSTAVRKSLSRLVQENKIKRIGQGIYIKPKFHKLLGELSPSIQSVVEYIAKKEHIIIKPTGAHALNLLGLSTQVQTKAVYLTNGAKRVIKIGNQSALLKPTTNKKMALKGKISSLLIIALEELKLDWISNENIKQIEKLIELEKREVLLDDLRLAPARVSDYLFKNFLKT